MNDINKIIIIGMGALGLLYGSQIQNGAPEKELVFLMDNERKIRHKDDRVLINGKEYQFTAACPDEYTGVADLIIFATKYHGLKDAALLAQPFAGPDTTIISVLNGITSEEILSEYFDREQIIDCVAIGMDAMREGSVLSFQNAGRLQIGKRDQKQKERLKELIRFFEEANMPYEECADIRHAMWNKFMINVGINQTCMVYETTYQGAIRPGKAHDDMIAAMGEVVEIAGAEGVSLTKEDLEADLLILNSLNPDGYPSMRQDSLAGRPTEVDLFAGTVVNIARKHGIAVPVNEEFLKTVREIEHNKNIY